MDIRIFLMNGTLAGVMQQPICDICGLSIKKTDIYCVIDTYLDKKIVENPTFCHKHLIKYIANKQWSKPRKEEE